MIKEKFNKMLDNIEKEELIIQKIMLPSKMVDRKITKEFIHNQTKTKIIEQFSKKETYYFPQELKLKIIKLIKTLSKDKNLYIKTSYPKEDYITITTTKKEIIPNPQFIQIEIYTKKIIYQTLKYELEHFIEIYKKTKEEYEKGILQISYNELIENLYELLNSILVQYQEFKDIKKLILELDINKKIKNYYLKKYKKQTRKSK